MITEELETTRKSANPLHSYIDAKMRDKAARAARKEFDTDAHVDRLIAAIDILKRFFGRNPDYVTARGIGNHKPFESIKYQWVGSKLSRTPKQIKEDQLYTPLTGMGDVTVKSANGHLIVRVYA